ncbi:MAG TPA: peptide ABC transporter substrate-binding protein [Candidatus Cottocaccamicrobium excrementipullorum]|nr:peptide ABC transporter substrate-binding protein [Candidatus Cottocaccamicrobium excrementipullorum]
MRKVKKLVSLALSSAMVLSLAACGGSSKETTAASEAAETTAASEAESTEETTAADTASSDGFNLAVCLASEPQTIDPALNSAVDGAIMINHMFEGLVKWVDDGEGNAVTAPGQAESWEKVVNDDGTVTYTFTLRDGIKWSDGQPVTAGDFEYSWKRLANPETAADYCYMIDMVQGYASVADGSADPDTLGVKALDDKTLEVTLSYDCPYFEEIMAFPATFPVRQDVVEGNDEWTYDVSTYIGNGPYKMAEWSHNAYILAEKNENYYDYDNLGPDTIRFTLLDDANAMLAAYNSGELDFIENFPTDEMANYLASGEITVADYLGTYYVCFNTEDEVFSDPLIREAFSLAIDRNYIVENVSQAGEVPATAYVPSGVNDAEGPSGDDFRTVGGEYYSVAEEDYEANCERARELLAEAGYPNGEGFPTVEYTYNTDDKHKAIAEALQNMWQEVLGVTVTLSNQDWNVFLESRKQGDYQIARNGWIADYNDPCSFLDMWYTGGGNNDAQYSNPEYDALIDAAKATSNQEERMAAFHQAEDILIGQDSVLAPIYFYTQPYMLADDIQGMYYTPLGYFFFGYTSQQ